MSVIDSSMCGTEGREEEEGENERKWEVERTTTRLEDPRLQGEAKKSYSGVRGKGHGAYSY